MRFPVWITLLYTCVLLSALAARLKKSYITSECYGSVLSLSCKPGHRIKVLDDFFGVSERILGPTMCRFEPGDCTVTNSRFTSVIHRYCEGKQTCTTFQVDRRFCGNNQTNYEQVEYACVPDSDITSICSDTVYTTNAGYISTPNFPNEYPTDMDCTCSLRINQAHSRIKLEATHFIVKYDNPCRDWLEIDVLGRKRRLCGAYRSTLRSPDFNLTFHSDDKDGHQGVWLYFAVDPPMPNTTLTVECGKEALLSPSLTSTTTPEPSTTVSTSEEDLLFINNNQSRIIDETKNATQSKTEQKKDEEKSNKENETNEENIQSKQNTEVENRQNSKNRVTKSELNNGEDKQVDIIDDTGHVREYTTVKKNRPTLPPANDSFVKDNQGQGQSLVSRSSNRQDSTGNMSEGFKDREQDSQEDIIRQRNRTTGIIIISICVGGIVLLVAILGILLCLNKRKRPKRVAERERKKRLQQRLNSLSFYDSIPLYDSVGRKGGGQMSHILQLPPPPPPPPGTETEPGPSQPQTAASAAAADKITTLDCNKDTPQTLDPKTLPYKAWSPSPEMGESEVDSAIYAELDKHWRGAAASDEATTAGEATSTCTKESNTPNEEGPPGYSLHLKSPDTKSEDIYTHV